MVLERIEDMFEMTIIESRFPKQNKTRIGSDMMV